MNMLLKRLNPSCDSIIKKHFWRVVRTRNPVRIVNYKLGDFVRVQLVSGRYKKIYGQIKKPKISTYSIFNRTTQKNIEYIDYVDFGGDFEYHLRFYPERETELSAYK